jgi:arylformamidase
MKLHDITVAVSPDLPVYPGDPAVEIEKLSCLARGDVCAVSRVSFGTHTGTHLDPPSHFVAGGAALDELPLDVLIGPARVVDAGDVRAIDAGVLESFDLSGVERVLFKTRNSRLWREAREFAPDYVYIEADAAEKLAGMGMRLVGIDYLSVEKFDFDVPRTHYALLGSNVVVVEGLDLSGVEAGDYELICLPLKIKGGDGAPARVVLREVGGRQ